MIDWKMFTTYPPESIDHVLLGARPEYVGTARK